MIQQRLQETEEKHSNQGLKAEFNELKSKEVEKATTKVVNFKVQVGCGCGGGYKNYHAEVPIDSHIESGDYLSDFQSEMTNIEEGWV